MTIFLRRELRVWPNLDVEVSLHSTLLEHRPSLVLIGLYSFMMSIYPIVSHNLHDIADEID